MLSFYCLPFSELTPYQLYDIIQLREAVFVVEQNCPYLDCDGKDQDSYHVIGVGRDGNIEATTRIVPPGLSYEGYASIGRVVTSESIRGQKQGRPLMQFSIDKSRSIWPGKPIKISAQIYIKEFYASLGFEEVGEPYLEDDIPHIAMVLT